MNEASILTEDGPRAPTRERIRSVAANLYVVRGHGGFSFGDIAEAIGTTRANIHHHFGNKRQLMSELIERFVADAESRITHHWTGASTTFSGRFTAQLEDLRRFYDRFNPAPGDRNVWSPLARLRLDLAVLGELAAHALERMDRIYDSCLRHAVAEAVKSGEFVAATPVEDVARVLRVTLLSCAPMTQDSGSFREIERLFAAVERMIVAAWGRKAATRKRARRAVKAKK
jgi:AcrR family transcriptional regulator